MRPQPSIPRPGEHSLADLSLGALLERFASEEPDLGGGSAAALGAGMAAALVTAVARRSRRSWPEAAGVAAQARALEARCLKLAQADADAFAVAVAALASETEVEEPLREAVAVLLELGETAADVAALAAVTAERCDGRFRGDAAAAARLAEAATAIVATLVEANLTVGAEDERLAAARRLVDAARYSARQAGEDAP